MFNLHEYDENYAEGALSNLRTSKKALQSEIYNVAFHRALWCGENVLKAVLVKAGKFDPTPRGDKHHHGWSHFQKIKRLGILPNSLLPAVENTVYDLFTIDINSGKSHANSTAPSRSIIGDLRYIAEDRFVKKSDGIVKVTLAEKLVTMLQSYM